MQYCLRRQNNGPSNADKAIHCPHGKDPIDRACFVANYRIDSIHS